MKNFIFFNSGTYSSQWIVLDYKVFDKINSTNKLDNEDEKKITGLLYVLEQIPNSIIYHDLSEKLIKVFLFNKIHNLKERVLCFI